MKTFSSKLGSFILVFTMMLMPITPVAATGEPSVELVPSLITGNIVSLEMLIDSAWEGYFNGTITLENTGSSQIDNWALSFAFPHSITNIWNAVIFEQADGMYTVKNAESNQDIPVGGSVSFGFTAQQNGDIESPGFYFINTAERTVPLSDYEAKYTLYSDWGSGFNGEIALVNKSSQTIEDWSLSMDFPRKISTVSNSVFTKGEGAQYCFDNPGYGQNINASQSITISIQGTDGTAADQPSNFTLSQISVGVSLTGDYDADGVKDYEELLICGTDPLVSDANTEPDRVTDTDSDGIPNYYEAEIGTDPLLADTDGDGIDDMTEVVLGSDPLLSDSDNDGILDGDVDEDQDGLSLKQEKELGTYFFAEDSDFDGLPDGDEVNTYGTDPTLDDTDGDTLHDGEEILLGKNPLNQDSDGDGIPDNEQNTAQMQTFDMSNSECLGISLVDVEMNLAHSIDSAVTVKDDYNIDVLSTGIRSRIGSPISFECEEDFDLATVVFHYDESALGNTEEHNLGVLWYDEENNVYVVQEQAVIDEESNSITLELEHFSTYIIVDLGKWQQDISTTIEYEKPEKSTIAPYNYDEEKYSYIFMVEDSLYFTEANRLQAITIMKQFANNMRTGEQMTVGRVYNNYGYGWNSMTSDKSYMGSAIDYYMASDFVPGVYTGISTRFDVLASVRYFESHKTNYNPGNIPVLILITTNSAMVYDSEMYDIAEANNGRVFAINISETGLTDGGFDETLSQFMSETGGFALSGTSDEMLYQYVHPKVLEIGNENLDTDGDGLYDWLETGGMRGIDGNIYYTDPNAADTDGDLVSDGQEMGACISIEKTSEGDVIVKVNGVIDTDYIASVFSRYATQTTGINYVFLVNSDPYVKDSDKDGPDDYNDADPSIVNDAEINILFYSEFESDALYWQRKYESEGYRVESNECNTIATFKDIWNNMGLDGTKEKYELEKVYLLFHGDVGGICFGDSDANGVIDWLGTDFFKESEKRYYTECKNKGIDYSVLCRDSLSELNIKKINTLVLNICESGNINFTNPNEWYNLAIGFISTQPYLQTVRGWNGYYFVSNNDLGFREYGVYDGSENIEGDEIKESQAYDYYRNEYGEIVYLINDNIEQTGIYTWWGK